MTPFLPSGATPPDQIGFVTEDLEATVRVLAALTGCTRWALHGYDGDVLRHRSYHGASACFASRNAVAPGGVIGVVQPLAGPSVHLDALARVGPGLAYVTWFVDDVDEAAARRAPGVREVMRGGGHGLDGDGEFLYLDTVETLGVFTQFVVRPRRRRPPAGWLDVRTRPAG